MMSPVRASEIIPSPKLKDLGIMEKFNRAVRRHHLARLKKARARYWGRGYSWNRSELTSKQSGMVVSTPAPCSCWMCCNPRRSWTTDQPKGITFQEAKQLEFFHSSLEELSCND